MSGSYKPPLCPWWGTILCGIAAYCFLRYWAPQLATGNVNFDRLLAQGPSLAPIVTIPLLLLAAKQLYDIPARPEDMPQEDEEDDE